MSEENNFEKEDKQKFEEPKNGNIQFYFRIGSHSLRTKLSKIPKLTKREIDVCVLIRCNLSIKDKANYFCISERTVETHRCKIRAKVGLEKGKSLYKFIANLDTDE
jgi:DNA-binding NarL/FixJ family response regulator